MTGGACRRADGPADEVGFRSDQVGVPLPYALVRYRMSAVSTHHKRAVAVLACVYPNAAGLDIGSAEDDRLHCLAS